MSDTLLHQDMIDCTADLPNPFTGYFERVIVVRTGDAYTRMNVFAPNAVGKVCYVRAFVGPFIPDCYVEFADWISGLYCTEIV